MKLLGKVLLFLVLSVILNELTKHVVLSILLSAVFTYYIAKLINWLESKNEVDNLHPLRIRLYKDDNTIMNGVIPGKLVNKYLAEYKDNPIISEDAYNKFILSNLDQFEAINFFSDLKRESDRFLAATSHEFNDKFSAAKQEYHISYYNDEGKIEVITSINGIPFTKQDVQDFAEYNSKNVGKGEKVLASDLQNWIDEREDTKFQSIIH